MAGDEVERFVAALALWGAPRLDELGEPPEGWLAVVRQQRLVGVAAAAVASGDLVVSEQDRARLIDDHRRAMSEVLVLDARLVEIAAVLEAAGLGFRVLKGSALAHQVHRDPSQRTYGDVDLLVAGADMADAVSAVGRHGIVRLQPGLGPGYDARFAKSVTTAGRGIELDLHRTIAPGPFGLLVDLDDLWADESQFEVADGRALPTLSPAGHLMQSAYHLVLGDVTPRLGHLRDLALMIHAAAASDAVAETCARWAARWRGEAVLIEAAALVTGAGGDAGWLGEWARGRGIDDADRRRIEASASERRRFARQSWESLMVLSGRDRLGYARAVLVGTAASRRARGLSLRHQVARVWSGVRSVNRRATP